MAKTIEGYAAVFFKPGDSGSEYRLAEDVVERIMPSAFDKVLASSDDVTALYNHNPDYLLGRRAAGTLRLSKDSRGLKYSIDYHGDDPQHQTVYAKLRRGDLIGSSFSFTVRSENVRRDGRGFVRELFDVNLIEVSPVWRPAYESTTASARGDEPTAPRSGAQPGSVRWCYENPHSPEAVQERLRELRQERLRHIERELVLDRLAMIARG